MEKLSPIWIRRKGTDDVERSAIREGVNTILEAAGVKEGIEVIDMGHWSVGGGPWDSMDWYVRENMLATDRGFGRQVNGDHILDMLETDPRNYRGPRFQDLLERKKRGEYVDINTREGHLSFLNIFRKARNEPPLTELENPEDYLIIGENIFRDDHYDVFVIDNDMGYKGMNFIVGVGNWKGTVISVRRFRGLDDEMRHACVRTEVMHELGHTFDAASTRYGADALGDDNSNPRLYANHCANECVMRQGNVVPTAWVKMSQDWLRSGKPFCDECVQDMRGYFSP